MDTSSGRLCSRCNQGKPLAEFHRCAANPDGLQRWCVDCRRAQKQATKAARNERERANYAAAPGKVLAYQKQWREANPAKAKATGERWRAKDVERARAGNAESMRRQYAANPSKYVQRSAAYRVQRPDLVWLQSMRRAATRWGTVVFTATYQDWLEIQAEHGHRCHYCGTEGKLLAEHKTPLARGGEHTRDNIVPACHKCNVTKNQLTEAEFAVVRARDMRRIAWQGP